MATAFPVSRAALPVRLQESQQEWPKTTAACATQSCCQDLASSRTTTSSSYTLCCECSVWVFRCKRCVTSGSQLHLQFEGLVRLIRQLESIFPNRCHKAAPAHYWSVGYELFGAERSDERCREIVLPTDGGSLRYGRGGKASVLP
jgi:hypothetical protein